MARISCVKMKFSTNIGRICFEQMKSSGVTPTTLNIHKKINLFTQVNWIIVKISPLKSTAQQSPPSKKECYLIEFLFDFLAKIETGFQTQVEHSN